MKKQLFSSTITVLVLAMLVLAGPGSAIKINVADLGNVKPGRTTPVNFNVVIEDGESIDIQGFRVIFQKDDYVRECLIGLDETSDCEDLTNIKINLNSDYGYGYGYGYGHGYGYGYGPGAITVHSKWDVPINFPQGKYDVIVEVLTEEVTFSSEEEFDVKVDLISPETGSEFASSVELVSSVESKMPLDRAILILNGNEEQIVEYQNNNFYAKLTDLTTYPQVSSNENGVLFGQGALVEDNDLLSFDVVMPSQGSAEFMVRPSIDWDSVNDYIVLLKNGGFELYIDSTTKELVFGSDSTQSGAAINLAYGQDIDWEEKWYEIKVVWGLENKIYVDGVDVTTASYNSEFVSGNELFVGTYNDGGFEANAEFKDLLILDANPVFEDMPLFTVDVLGTNYWTVIAYDVLGNVNSHNAYEFKVFEEFGYCYELEELFENNYPEYDSRLDFNNDGVLDLSDVSTLAQNNNDEVWCKDQLMEAPVVETKTPSETAGSSNAADAMKRNALRAFDRAKGSVDGFEELITEGDNYYANADFNMAKDSYKEAMKLANKAK